MKYRDALGKWSDVIAEKLGGMSMDDIHIFISAYWLWGEEEGHTVHFDEARAAFRHGQRDEEYDFLLPYYRRCAAYAELIKE